MERTTDVLKKVVDADPVRNSDNSKSKENKKESLKLDCPCLIEARLCPVRKVVTVRCVDGSHNHRIVNDPLTYHLHRKLDADIFEEAILLLQKNKPSVVQEVCILKLLPE